MPEMSQEIIVFEGAVCVCMGGTDNKNHKHLTLFSLKAVFIQYSPDIGNSENQSDHLVTSEAKTMNVQSA